jgi:hypothetical protein
MSFRLSIRQSGCLRLLASAGSAELCERREVVADVIDHLGPWHRREVDDWSLRASNLKAPTTATNEH